MIQRYFWVIVILMAITFMLLMPKYMVYWRQQTGLAELERAKYTARAEIERAKGVAEANEIIGKSLQANENYLKYLWITSLKDGKGELIYVPTEAQIPILEASRLNQGSPRQ